MFNIEMNEYFRDMWSHFDQDATGFINPEDFPKLLFKLGSPLGWSKFYESDSDLQKEYVEKIDIPLNKETQTY